MQRLKQPAAGGLCSIEFVPVNWIVYFPEVNPKYNTITQRIRLLDGKAWQVCPAPDRERSLIEAQKQNDGGMYIDSTIQAFLPFDSASNEVALKVMRYYRYIVVVNMPNGIRKLIGSMDNPARFSRDFNTGGDYTADMGSPIQFTWSSEDGPLIYLGIPSETEIVAAAPRLILGEGSGQALGGGTGSVIGTNSNYP